MSINTRAAYVLTSSPQGHTITDGGPSLHHRPPPRANFPRGVTWLRRVRSSRLRAAPCHRLHSARPSPAGSCPNRDAANKVETLGPLTRLEPGAHVDHVERWLLAKVAPGASDEELDEHLLPVAAGVAAGLR